MTDSIRRKFKSDIISVNKYTFDNCGFKFFIIDENSPIGSEESLFPDYYLKKRLGKYYHYNFILYRDPADTGVEYYNSYGVRRSNRPYNYHNYTVTRLDEYTPFDFNELNNNTCGYVISMEYQGSLYLSKDGDKYSICSMGWDERWNINDCKRYFLDYTTKNYLTKEVFEGLIKDIENFHQQIRLLETK